jgi:hypothetical protein
MQRHTKAAADFRAPILADLQKEPGCEYVTDLVIQRIDALENGANWTVKNQDPKQDKVCEVKLKNIARLLQPNFDLADRGG